jgi:hypothetical protein
LTGEDILHWLMAMGDGDSAVFDNSASLSRALLSFPKARSGTLSQRCLLRVRITEAQILT